MEFSFDFKVFLIFLCFVVKLVEVDSEFLSPLVLGYIYEWLVIFSLVKVKILILK